MIIRDRNRPVAKLVPFVAEGLSEHELMLVATGQMRLAERPRDIERILKMPRPKIEGYSGLQALLDEREEDGR